MRLATTTLMVVIGCLSIAAADQRPSTMIDVALNGDRHLISRCEDLDGHPVGDAIVELVRDRELICWTTSGPDGGFTLRDVKPGVYRLQCGDCDRTIRVWDEASAPPAGKLPFVVVVGVTPLPALGADVLPPSGVDEPSADEQEPVLPLQLQEGSRRKAGPVTEDLTDAAPPAAEAVDSASSTESRSQNAHAHHAIATTSREAPFDPFARTQSDLSQLDEPQFVDVSQEPLAAPAQEQQQHQQLQPQAQQLQPPHSPNPQPAFQPPPHDVPPCPEVRYIRRSVGPTVGDVVVTSFGVAGITMGIIGIHKYENRKIRRVVSP